MTTEIKAPQPAPGRYWVDYDNDYSPADGHLVEWWTVIDEQTGDTLCKCDKREDADRIAAMLNGAETPAPEGGQATSECPVCSALVVGVAKPKAEDINAQKWAGMDGATAFHLIQRHGEDWSHVGRLMEAWRIANTAAAQSPAEGALTDEQIDAMLSDIDDIARNVDFYEFGLPIADEPRAAMREAVRAAIASKVQPKGLSEVQEPKYTVNGSAIVNRASGEAIPADEPVFIFRARDWHAVNVLAGYAREVKDPAHAAAVWARVEDFKRFWNEHPDRMKAPDTDCAAPAVQTPAPAHEVSLLARIAEYAENLERGGADASSVRGLLMALNAEIEAGEFPTAARSPAVGAASVELPPGMARSDAEFWLRKRGEIIDALRAEGLTMVTTLNGVQFMRLGRIEAQSTDEVAALVRQAREVCAATLRAGPGVAVEIPAKLAEEGRKFMRGEPNLIEQMPFADVQKLGDLLGDSHVPVQGSQP